MMATLLTAVQFFGRPTPPGSTNGNMRSRFLIDTGSTLIWVLFAVNVNIFNIHCRYIVTCEADSNPPGIHPIAPAHWCPISSAPIGPHLIGPSSHWSPFSLIPHHRSISMAPTPLVCPTHLSDFSHYWPLLTVREQCNGLYDF